jgi:DNA-binding MarR family transcriptional regulator
MAAMNMAGKNRDRGAAIWAVFCRTPAWRTEKANMSKNGMSQESGKTPQQTALKLSEFFPYHLSFAAELMSAEIAALMEEKTGLSMTQWRVMAVIGTFSPISTREVAAYTTMNKVAVSRAVASLVDMNLLVCRQDMTDNRLVAISFTPKGQKAFKLIGREATLWASELLSGFSLEEIATVRSFLGRLQGKLKALRKRRLEANAA